MCSLENQSLPTMIPSVSKICSKAYSSHLGLTSKTTSYTAYIQPSRTYLPCFQSTMKQATKEKPIQEDYTANVCYGLGWEMGGWEWLDKRKNRHAQTCVASATHFVHLSICSTSNLFHKLKLLLRVWPLDVRQQLHLRTHTADSSLLPYTPRSCMIRLCLTHNKTHNPKTHKCQCSRGQ